MSAIAGLLHLSEEPVNIDHGRRLMRELERYPADDVQTWHSDKVFLGCHAQWITPESFGEKLPYYDHDRKLAITADAIIDNREELFEVLQVKKERRKQITDSELILLSYHKWGEDSPKHLIGDFAFMIWDEKKHQLFGARDPSGYRTLYYYMDNFKIAFCTTMNPLLSLPYVDKILNEEYIAEFLAITGMIDTVDARITPIKNINQIPPFHSITFKKDNVKITRYGSFTPEKKLNLKSNGEYIEAFQDIFQKAVNSRLRTSRGIGSFLSGGLDSGSVVGYAAKKLRDECKTIHTFSYIPPRDFTDFTRKELMPDERPFIKKTIDYIGGITPHFCAFEGRNSYSEIDNTLEVMEMPYKFFENSFWLKGIFEKAYEEDVGILLNGERGNFTISWGSAIDYYAILLRQLKWLKLVRELNQYSLNTGGARFRNLPLIARRGFPFLNKIMDSNKQSKISNNLIDTKFAERTKVFEKLSTYGIDHSGWIGSQNLFEQKRITFEEILPWNSSNTLDTKLSLRYSLWKRDPTNDIRVVRFCFGVPEDQVVQNGVDRALIRRATKNILPDEIRMNQRVRGIQAADWIHRMIPHWTQFINEVKELSIDKTMLEFVDGQVIKSAINSAEKGVRKEDILNPDYRTLMRSLIVYKYVRTFT